MILSLKRLPPGERQRTTPRRAETRSLGTRSTEEEVISFRAWVIGVGKRKHQQGDHNPGMETGKSPVKKAIQG